MQLPASTTAELAWAYSCSCMRPSPPGCMHQSEYIQNMSSALDGVPLRGERLPAHISRHIDFIQPGILPSTPVRRLTATRAPIRRESTMSVSSRSPTDTSSCGLEITPACLKALYNIPDAQYNHYENTLGVFSTGPYSAEDLDSYFSHYAPWVPKGTRPTVFSMNGESPGIPMQ